MMRKTKKKFIELCCQLFSGEPEKSLAQINIERALRGEDQFLIEPKHLKQIGITSWIFGFVVNNSNNQELLNIFDYGLNHDWFYSDVDDDLKGLFDCAMDDTLLKNRELYTILSDYYITHFEKSPNICYVISKAYALSLTNLEFEKISELHKRFPINC